MAKKYYKKVAVYCYEKIKSNSTDDIKKIDQVSGGKAMYEYSKALDFEAKLSSSKEGRKKLEEEAAEYCRLAADQWRYPEAARAYSEKLTKGKGVIKNEERAKKYEELHEQLIIVKANNDIDAQTVNAQIQKQTTRALKQ